MYTLALWQLELRKHGKLGRFSTAPQAVADRSLPMRFASAEALKLRARGAAGFWLTAEG